MQAQAAANTAAGTPLFPAGAAPAVVPAAPGSNLQPSGALEQQQQQPPPLTPLQQRQWQRAAQRSVRLAVTAFKAARTRMLAASDAGTTAATALTNSLLTLEMLPVLPLPPALAAADGLQAAAACKLCRQQQQHIQELAHAVTDYASAVAAMRAALEDVEAQLSGDALPAQVMPGSSQQQGRSSDTCAEAAAAAGAAVPPAAAPQHARMLRVLPVFHALCLPETVSMLQSVLQMHAADLDLKQQLLQAWGDEQAAVAAAKRPGSRGSDAALRGRLMVALTCWMTRPPVSDDDAEQLLQVLTDEMTGL